MKLAYIGYDALYPALPALAQAGCEIGEIITCQTDNDTEFNIRVCAYAREHRIPLTVGKMTRQDIARLRANGCRGAVCAGYYHCLPVDEQFPIVNIHPSLLPEGRGAWPMPVVLLRGLSETGITAHKVTEGFDEGDILLQERVPVSPDDDLETLTEKLRGCLPGMMAALASDFDGLWASARPQGPGEYWPCPSETDWPMGPDTPAREADRILRAFFGYECVYRAEGRTWGVTRGVLRPTGEEGLPVQGGTIRGERIRQL